LIPTSTRLAAAKKDLGRLASTMIMANRMVQALP
jgi:hypothetical protein